MARKPDIEKQKRILDSSFSVFGEMGYKNAGIKEIARRAHVAAGSIYTYFNNKETLFAAAMLEAGTNFLQEITAATVKKSTPDEKFTVILEIGFTKIRAIHCLMQEMFSDSNILDMITGSLDTLCREIISIIRPKDGPGSADNTDLETYFVKTLISGIFLSLAVTDRRHLGTEIEKIKSSILHSLPVRQEILV